MDIQEAIGRRYCAFRGENPDAIIDGRPVWRLALEDVRISMNVLETFNIDTGTTDLFERSGDQTQLQLSLGNKLHGLKAYK